MDTITQFCVGSLFVLSLCMFGACIWVVHLLWKAHQTIALLSEKALLASKSSTAKELADAMSERDQARADVETLQNELAKTVPTGVSSQKADDDDVLFAGNIPLLPVRR